jgi:F-type H+-transporting ATPase subunit b
MSTLLQQLGGLVLGSVPTMVLFLLTLVAYRWLVHVPLKKVLAERYAKTQGALEKARAAIDAAERKTAEYEHALRTARAAAFRERQERLHHLHLESEQMLNEARAQAQERVAAALIAIELSAETARLQLETSLDGLTAAAIRAVLPAAPASQAVQKG